MFVKRILSLLFLVRFGRVKKSLCFVLLTLLLRTSDGQSLSLPVDAASQNDPNYAMKRYQELLRHNDPVMYLALPVIKPVITRAIPLMDGEGKDGYWAEGQFANRFVAYRGKYYSPSLLQRIRFTFDVSILSRLTRDESNPLLPTSNKFGPGLDLLISSLKKLYASEGGMMWATFQLHHYSNGQADSFFIDAPEKRNNYESGDFSTNYWRASLNFSSNSINKNFVIAGLGYQHEVDLGGPFTRSKELSSYYGDGRVVFNFLWIKKPQLKTRDVINRRAKNSGPVKLERSRHFSIRTELEYVTGAMPEFDHDKKYRLGCHVYLNYMPSVTNEIGFMVHSFIGRDYLNIRFDDIVYVGQLGLFFKFNAR